MLSSKKKSTSYEKLILSSAKDHRGSLKALYKAEAQHMIALAYKCLHHHQFSDQAVLKTFLSIWDNAGTYRSEMGSAHGWMYSILRHHINELYQEHYETLALTHSSEPPFVPDNMSEIVAQRNEGTQMITNCQVFEQLSPEQQKCIVNKYFSPETTALVATRLNLPLARFIENIHSGLSHIAKQLKIFPQHEDTVLIGKYALGTLNRSGNEQVISILSQDPDAMIVLMAWESFFTQFIKQLPATTLNPRLAKELATRVKLKQDQKLRAAVNKSDTASDVEADPDDLTLEDEKPASLGLKLKYYLNDVITWRVIAGVCVLLMLLAWLYSGASHTTDRSVAVLTTTDSERKPAWILKESSKGDLELHPLLQVSQISGQNYVLWVADAPNQWRRLDKLDPSHEAKISPETEGPLKNEQNYMISLEPEGSQQKGPQGARLYQGTSVLLDPEY